MGVHERLVKYAADRLESNPTRPVQRAEARCQNRKWMDGDRYGQRSYLFCNVGVHMGESKRSIDNVRSFWMDAIFIALGIIALFAGVALGLAILMAE